MSSCRRNEIDLRHDLRGWLLIIAAEHFVFSRQLIWSRLSGAPGRPGEFHPEPPTDPDVNLSIHPARATQRRLPPSIRTRSSSGCPLTPPDVGDLLPLLHGHYPISSLLRSSAPLIGASVLSASWVFHLCLFP